jgi:hypothetical protein
VAYVDRPPALAASLRVVSKYVGPKNQGYMKVAGHGLDHVLTPKKCRRGGEPQSACAGLGSCQAARCRAMGTRLDEGERPALEASTG